MTYHNLRGGLLDFVGWGVHRHLLIEKVQDISLPRARWTLPQNMRETQLFPIFLFLSPVTCHLSPVFFESLSPNLSSNSDITIVILSRDWVSWHDYWDCCFELSVRIGKNNSKFLSPYPHPPHSHIPHPATIKLISYIPLIPLCWEENYVYK